MLTLLSRTLRRFFDTAPARAREASPSPRAECAALPASCAMPRARSLRLVETAEAPRGNRDNSIRVPLAGASAFVAGAGARIYSLDAFRLERPYGPPAPRKPRAA